MSWHHNYAAWLDEDGKHIWFRHQCVNGAVLESMLPYPTWHQSQKDRTVVEPSIVCNDCHFHEFVSLSVSAQVR